MKTMRAGRGAVIAAVTALSGAPAAGQEAGADGRDLVLDTLTVTTRVADGAAPLDGIVPTDTATATKIDVPILETPQSVSVVGAEQIRVTGATSIDQALRYTAGVTPFAGSDPTGDSLVSRGFRIDPYYGSVFRDGMRYSVNVFDGGQEPYGLERVELLRGPSGILYGQSGPAGIINTVSKRPPDVPLHEMNVTLGSFNTKQVSGDFGGPLDAEGKFAYRLTGLWRDADTFVDYVPDDRTFFAPAFRWSPDERTSLTFIGLYQRDRTAYIYGLPAEGTVDPNPNGRIDRDRFVGEPGFDKFVGTQKSATILYEHEFEAPFTLRIGARYFWADQDMPNVWASGLEPDMRHIFRGAQDREDWSEGLTADTSLQYDWAAFGTDHTTLLGFDVSSTRHQTKRWDRTADPLDLFDPVYGGPIGTPTPALWSDRDKTDRYGVYLQDQIHVGDRWVVSLGGRQDWITYNDRGAFTGEVLVDDERSDAFTGRAGVIYLAPNGIAPFLSYSTSFEPTSGFDRLGQRFKPTTGKQIEGGVRYQPPGTAMLVTASIYQITQNNVTVTDPVDTNFSIQEGEVRSRGVELEAQASLTDNLNLIAAYAYTDARTIKSSPLTPENDGKRTSGVPYNQASLWADYGFARFGLPNLRAGAGVRYVGETVGTWTEAQVPGYTLIDAMAEYDFANGWRVALNGQNLTDKTYVQNCTYACFYGEPRSVQLTLTRTW